MATMWPREIPSDIAGDPFRSSEIRVFQKLKKELTDSWVVFYARPWLGCAPDGSEIDGECDFIVAHPDRGFLALEVKGGGISYDPLTDKWFSHNRYGNKNAIKDPLRQAMVSKKQILHKLNERYGKRKNVIARHGVIFPDCSIGPSDLSAEAPRQVICDGDELDAAFESWIVSRFAGSKDGAKGETALGDSGIEILHDIFAKPIHLNIPLRRTLSEDEHSLDVLTQDQFRMLKFIEGIPRVAIPGGAGTGKTVLAVQELIGCSKKGMRSLYTCYNDGLVARIREQMRDAGWLGCEVLNFHEICLRFCKDASIPVPDQPDEKEAKREYFETTLPSLLDRAVDHVAKRYDALIVDEGQDFRSNWWGPLLKTLADTPEARLRIFYDDNQRLYDSTNLLPIRSEVLPVNLSRNLRNTRKIFELVSRHYKGPKMDSAAPEGFDVNWVETETEKEIFATVMNDLTVMLHEEKIPPESITVLLYSQDEVKRLRKACRNAGITCRACDEPDSSEAIVVDTIRRFKGLESFSLILALTAPAVNDRELIYIAISRPKTFLSVVGTPDVLDKVRKGDS